MGRIKEATTSNSGLLSRLTNSKMTSRTGRAGMALRTYVKIICLDSRAYLQEVISIHSGGKNTLGETIGGERPKPRKPEPEAPGVLKWFLAKIGCIDEH
jgi:hypothetical protein